MIINLGTGNCQGLSIGPADRVGDRAITISGMALLTVVFPFLAFAGNAAWATALLVPIGLMLAAPFGPMVVLGQSYLPPRPCSNRLRATDSAISR